jgi:hypothetical protein
MVQGLQPDTPSFVAALYERRLCQLAAVTDRRYRVLSRCKVCNTCPPASTNSTCIGIWPTAWVAQLRQGS